MSDAPRVDAEIESYAPPTRFAETVNADFARQLERELSEWHRIAGEKIAALERERDALIALRDDPYAIDCYIVPHEGDNMETMFRGNSPHLKDYAIIPRKQFDALRSEVERLTAERDTAIQHLGKQSRDAGLLEAEVERLRAALQKILDYDRRSMYERCPDCDYPNVCEKTKVCKSCPTSTAGDIARAALGEEER